MSEAAPRRTNTASEYLEAERIAETKHVFWDGELFANDDGPPAKAGDPRTHDLLVEAILGALRTRLRGTSFIACDSSQRIRLPRTGRDVHPDAWVAFQPVEIDPIGSAALTRPRVVFEVLDASTEAFDRGEKFLGYRSVPSLSDVLFVAHDQPRIEHYTRQTDASWRLLTYGPTTAVPIASPGIELPIDALYDGVPDPP